jgi:hypothetical protein
LRVLLDEPLAPFDARARRAEPHGEDPFLARIGELLVKPDKLLLSRATPSLEVRASFAKLTDQGQLLVQENSDRCIQEAG